MKSILLTAILAAVGFASKVSVLSFTNANTPVNFGIPAAWGSASAYHDVNFGYGLDAMIEEGESKGVMDSWIQGSLWSNVDLYLNLNFYETEILNIKLNIVPFQIIPLWCSFYHTHPAAVYKGIVDEFAAALDFGYLVEIGAVSVQYYSNSLMPKVSLLDLALGTSTVAFPGDVKDPFGANGAAINGWDTNVDANGQFVEEPFLKFNLLEWLIEEGKVEFENYASYMLVPLVGEIAAAQ